MGKHYDIVKGVTRTVILTKNYAFKIPGTTFNRSWAWKRFLQGLLCNIQEKEFSGWSDALCPVLFYIPGGWLVVMPRGEPLTDEEWERFDYNNFIFREDCTLPVERKQCSFKKFGNLIKAVDYGS